MPIYKKSIRLLMRDMVSELNLEQGQTITRQQVVAWFHAHYPLIKEGSITAHLIKLSTNARSRIHYSVKPSQDDLFYQIDSGRFRLYDPANDPTPIYDKTGPDDSEPEVEENESSLTDSLSGEFAYERDLQNYLAKNLHRIEPNLRLYEEEGITGREFPVGGRKIDILAVDANNNYVVIELKVSRGYDRVVGQLLRYMGWIKNHHADPQQEVRGIIIAREISEDLQLACSGVSNVELFEYQLAVSLSKKELNPKTTLQ
ncbi:hypothetical protein GCM10023189_38000 [Nibrella saemangeumensis]|uniref:Endonuclease NucS n=1 Tax=Nibrella saemangeumensis TaxID=1084526 RepID=A0ABP8N600_9BACT